MADPAPIAHVRASRAARRAYSPALRALVPHRLAVPVLRALDAARGGRADARDQMRHLLGGMVGPDELERLARRHRRERAVRDDLPVPPAQVRRSGTRLDIELEAPMVRWTQRDPVTHETSAPVWTFDRFPTR